MDFVSSNNESVSQCVVKLVVIAILSGKQSVCVCVLVVVALALLVPRGRGLDIKRRLV